MQDVRELLGRRSLYKAAAAKVPHAYMHPSIDFSTSSHDAFKRANLYRGRDVSTKRNLGLMLAQTLGWKKVFFLDDDIRDVTAADLCRVASLLGQYSCVGFSMDYFPDNSVVSHAKKLAFNSHQEIMISGAAMGVYCHTEMAFFPQIYNEDLFFILDDIAHGSVLHAGSVSQLPYEPFNHPERAGSEEFGEVLMEGLLALLHTRTSLVHATDAYWLEFLSARMKHITSVKRALLRKCFPDHNYALAAMRAAEGQLSEISPTLCVAYVTEWRADLVMWKQRLHGLTAQTSVAEALSHLDLAHVVASEDRNDAGIAGSYELAFSRKTVSSESPEAADQRPAYHNAASCETETTAAAASSSPSDLRQTGLPTYSASERILIRKITEEDWVLLRQVRLRALQDSPRAFTSSYHIEERFTAQQWRAVIKHDLQWFVALDRKEPIGNIAARSGPDIVPGERYLESMWVASSHRRSGVARNLIARLTETVYAEGAHTLLLWVLDGNDIARDVYLKLGFTSTGERQVLKTYPNRIEERMRRHIP